MNNKHTPILVAILAMFLVPPVGWFILSYYCGLWSFAELLKVAYGPYVWTIHVIPYTILIIYLSNKQLNNIDRYTETRDENLLEAAQKSVAFLPKLLLGILFPYCIFGPVTGMIAKPFLDNGEWWLSECLGVPFILLFSVPFIITFIYKLESYSKDVPLSFTHKPISLAGRFFIVIAFTLIGAVITLLILGLSLLYKNAGVPAAELFFPLLYRSIPIICVEIVLCFINMFVILRLILRVIKGTINFSKRVAEASGEQEYLELVSRDEFGRLTYYLNLMLDKLNDSRRKNEIANQHIMTVVGEVKTTSDSIADNISQISEKINESSIEANNLRSSMQHISSAAEQSSNNMNSVSAAVEEISSTINEIAGSTERTRVISSEAVTHSEEALENIKELQSNSSKISNVVDLINEIASQTNLLALNATIEAARAGEAGKGFAVVATEIKDLARKTTESIAEIQHITDSMQTSTTTTVAKIQAVNQVIATINEIVVSIASSLEEQNVTTKDIAKNVAETNQGVAETTTNVVAVNETCNNIATNLAMLSESINDIAEVVKSLNDTVQAIE